MILKIHPSQIRKALNNAFDDAEFDAFCLDYFDDLYDKFSSEMRKDYKMTLLLHLCRRRPTGFEDLLNLVRQEYEMSDFQRKELKPLIEALEAYLKPLQRTAQGTIPLVRTDICPFEYGPTVPPKRFYGRESQRVHIKTRIGGISAQCVSIVGMRRSGKSSLLRYIRERLAEFCSPEQQALVVTLNLQAKRFHTPDGLIEGLRRGIERQIARSPWQRDENDDEWAVEDGLCELRDTGKRLIVLIDEFESISNHLEQFQGWGDDWRAKASAGCFALVIATLRPLDDIYQANGLTSPFGNLFTQTNMQPFTKQEWRTLVRERFTMSGIQISQRDLALIDDLAGGWPFYTQMAAALLWEYGDHARTREAFKQQATPRFAELWKDLKESERQVLHNIIKPNRRLSSDTRTLQRYGIVRSDGKPFSSAFAEFVRGQG